jgi:hypothetical membrane protein
MTILCNDVTKILTPRLGALCGLAGAGIFAALWIAAVLADGHWVLGGMALSELGDRSRAGSSLFNSAVIVTGVLGLGYTVGLARALSRNLLAKIGSLVLGAACLFLIGVGVFPIDTGRPHTLASYGFFTLAAAALALLMIPLGRSRIFHRSGGLVTALLLAIPVLCIPLLSLAALEALAVVCLLVWIALISARMLVHHPMA